MRGGLDFRDSIQPSRLKAFMRGVGISFGMQDDAFSYPIARTVAEARYHEFLSVQAAWRSVGIDLTRATQKVDEALREKAQ